MKPETNLTISARLDAPATAESRTAVQSRLGEGFQHKDSARWVITATRWATLVSWHSLTPDYAEANAPPMLNYGWVYPQSLLIFTICIVYSVVTPLVLVFGAIYFGAACEWGPSASYWTQRLCCLLTSRSRSQVQASLQ
jgi:hypothetical protein